MVTLDDFFEGPDQTIDWHAVDAEFNEFAVEQLDTIGVILFGRVASWIPRCNIGGNSSAVCIRWLPYRKANERISHG
jgi:hypothetical protein